MTELREKLNNIVEEKQAKIIPENIRDGIQIFDVVGEYFGPDISDATVEPQFLLKDKTAYANYEKITGTMPNNGALNYNPSDFEQEIPDGYTSGGTVKSDITKLTHYKKCLGLASEIMTGTPHQKYVEYVSGTWLDTGVKLTSTISIEATIRSFTSQVYGDTTYAAFLGAWKDNDGLIFGRRNAGYYMTTGASDVFSGTELQMLNFHTFVYDPINNIYTVNGKSLNVTKTNGVDATIWLFRANGWFDYKSDTQISSCKIYDNGVLIHDYVPVVRAIDNVACMYDTVTETYLENQGDGKMFAGPEITG